MINQAIGSNLDLIVKNILDKDVLNLNPTAYSTKTNEIPKINRETI